MKVALFSTLVGEGKGYCKNGIGILSSVLKQHGHDVTLYHDFSELAIYPRYDIVGVSCLSSTITLAKKIATYFKDKAITIVGGPGATLSPEFLEESDFNYIFKGEGEITLPKILNAIVGSAECPINRIIHGEPVTDLDALPFIDRSGYEDGEQHHILLSEYHYAPMYSIINSRWCTKRCKFCAPATKMLYGGIKKIRSPQSIVNELKSFQKDMFCLFLGDDNLTQNKQWCYDFIDLLKQEDMFVPFIGQAYPGTVVRNAELLEKLKDAGLVGLLLGYESGSTRVLREMGKGSTREVNIECGNILNNLGIRQQCNLMFGNPTETHEERMETVDLYNNHLYKDGNTIACPAVYTPMPGSIWYDELKANGQITITSPDDFDRSAWTTGKIKDVDYNDVQRCISLLKPFKGFYN